MDLRFEQIMEVASGLFRKYGIRSVSMDDIANEMGISKKTLYQHFSNKNDLLERLLSKK